MMLTTGDCLKIIQDYGLPEPYRSSCWMCPHKYNVEWKVIRDQYPAEWEAACQLDEEIRENDRAAACGCTRAGCRSVWLTWTNRRRRKWSGSAAWECALYEAYTTPEQGATQCPKDDSA